MKNIILLFTFISLTFTANSQSVADSLYKQAKQYGSVGDVAKAVEYYTKTIEADPKFLNAYFNRGSTLAQQKKYQEALNDFINFNKISPNDYEVEYLMAACHYYLGDKNISFELVNKSLSNKPNFFDALKLKGTLFMDNGDYKKALENFDSALVINKNEPETYNLKGFCYEKMNDNEKALVEYYNSESLGYNNVTIYNNIGNILSYKKDYNKALIYFGKAIANDSSFALSYYNQGIAYDILGFTDLAIKNWRKAKELGFKNFSPNILGRLNEN